ncbi:MAG TPA: hypothetical protein VG184_03890 [Acidimicrobiales bacterium]|jgi:hypothetical protein|nr:hypothetical protein [Acidimicrobiales bacterium]
MAVKHKLAAGWPKVPTCRLPAIEPRLTATAATREAAVAILDKL